MIITNRRILIFLVLLFIARSAPLAHIPSKEFITAGINFSDSGIFQVTNVAYGSASTSQAYTVTFNGYTRSSNVFKVGFSLHSIDVDFDNVKLQFDLEVISISVNGFAIRFSSSQANLMRLLRICYFSKEPTFNEIFYI
jgi:hypothetical protein